MLDAVRSWYRSLTDVKRDEWLPASLMFLYGFLALTSYYVIKPARNSLFVDRVGAENLPYVYILTAVAVTVVMIGYSRYVDRVRELPLLLGTFGFLAANLVGFWWWLNVSQGIWSSGAFYVWGKLYPLLLVSQFFLVGNLLFTTKQARRLFGPIGAGLILGGIAGSSISGWMTSVVGTENLLLIAAGILGLCAVIVLVLSPHMTGGESASGRLVGELSGDALQLLRESSHLKTIAAILGLTIVVGTLIDWQFNSAAEQFIPGEDAKTAFFGQFFLWLNIASLLIQVFLTAFVLRRFGVGMALLVLPAGLILASVGVLAVPLLLTAVLAKGTEGALRYSLDQSTRELLYLPVANDVKYKVKPLIDLAVYRGGTGVGGVLLLVFVEVLDLPWEITVRMVAGLALACIGFWIVVAFRMREQFRDSIKRLIGVRDLDLDSLIQGRLGTELRDEIHGALRGGEERDARYVLSLLEEYVEPRFADDVVPLLDHDSEEVRSRALSLLHEMEADGYEARVRELLDDPSFAVRVDAIRYLCAHDDGEPEELLDRFLDSEEDRVRLAALACVLRYGEIKQASFAEETLDRMAASEMAEVRANAALLLGATAELPEWGADVLGRLLEDEATEVREAALRAVGRARLRSLVPAVLDRLATPGERAAAREALATFGTDIHGTLFDYLADPATHWRVRHEIPAILCEEADERVVEELLELLGDLEPEIRFQCLKELNKLRREREDLPFEEFELDELVEREVREAYLWAVRRSGTASEEGNDHLLTHLLDQRRLEAVDRATRLLGLQHDQADLYAAHAGQRSSDELTRQRAHELLEDTLPHRHGSMFDPLLNPDRSAEEVVEEARDRYAIEPAPRTVTLRTLAEGEDPWVAVLARRSLGMELDDRLVAAVNRRLLHASPDGKEIMDIVTRAERLRETEIFQDLRVEDLAGVGALVEEREYEKGDVLFEEGTAGSELFIVLEGRLIARRGERTLFTADAGQTVGDLSLLDSLPRNYRAEAASDCRVLVLGREECFDLMEERFRIARALLSHLSRVIRRLNEERAERPVAAGGEEGDRPRESPERESDPTPA